MRKRTQAREYTLQVLYMIDIGKVTPEAALEDFWQRSNVKDDDIREFVKQLVSGVNKKIKDKECFL